MRHNSLGSLASCSHAAVRKPDGFLTNCNSCGRQSPCKQRKRAKPAYPPRLLKLPQDVTSRLGLPALTLGVYRVPIGSPEEAVIPMQTVPPKRVTKKVSAKKTATKQASAKSKKVSPR